MQAQEFLLSQPSCDLSSEKQDQFENLFDSTPWGGFVDYQLAYSKWQFLSYLCQSRNLVLHGSQNPVIERVEPRKAIDVKAFSAQEAIYATTDGIWVIYFAIVDRKNVSPLSLFNSCVNIRVSPDQVLAPLYFFSITHSALIQKPWCDGVVYILPRETFEQEPAQQMMGVDITFPHWISRRPARPIAKLKVQPLDFPFLSKIHGHNDQKLAELSATNPNGFPWPSTGNMIRKERVQNILYHCPFADVWVGSVMRERNSYECKHEKH